MTAVVRGHPSLPITLTLVSTFTDVPHPLLATPTSALRMHVEQDGRTYFLLLTAGSALLARLSFTVGVFREAAAPPPTAAASSGSAAATAGQKRKFALGGNAPAAAAGVCSESSSKTSGGTY